MTYNKYQQEQLRFRSQKALDTLWNNYNGDAVEVYEQYLASLTAKELEQLVEKLVKETA
jgi:hypothetical protein